MLLRILKIFVAANEKQQMKPAETRIHILVMHALALGQDGIERTCKRSKGAVRAK